MNNNNIEIPLSGVQREIWPFKNELVKKNLVNKTNFIKISVVTISYNQATYLEGAIRSILLQNYPNIEYIIIDGGSKDGSVEIIKKYQSFLKYWVSEPDKGPANALNKGLSHCEGEYFYYLNSDDIIEPGVFHFINEYIQINSGYDIYYGHGYMTYGDIMDKFKIYSVKWNIVEYANHLIPIVQQSTFIKLSTILKMGGFNEENRTQWDGELLVDLHLLGAKFRRYNKHVCIFRVYPETITGNSDKTKYHEDFNRINKKVFSNKEFIPKYKFILRLKQLINDPLVSIKKIYTHFFYLK